MLWLDGACGIAGDMTVAALLDAGARREVLDTALSSLGTDGFSYEILKDVSHGIAGTRFRVNLHSGNATHAHGEHHHHAHRHLADIEKILARGTLSDRARNLAFRAFRIVAEAEAKAHGVPVSEVHFHEVGAEDSIADIVGASVLFDALGVSECVVGELTEGSGTVVCAHGELPVPVPAVLNIAAAHGISLRKTETRSELVTPTGIALAAAFRTRERLPEKFRVRNVGIGLGTREIGRANLLRAILIEEENAAEKRDEEPIFQLVSNIDDATGEMLGLAAEEIVAAGALDVCFAPCFMKKNRPAYQLQILVAASRVPAVEAALFRATTTIGVRKWRVERTCLEREIITAKLPFGDVRVKRCRTPDGNVRDYPEFDDVRALARKTDLPFEEIFNAAKKACDTQ